MILQQIKKHIFECDCVSRKELAKKFALSEDGVDAMLELWIKKGQLSRIVDLDKQKNIRQVRYKAVQDDGIPLMVFS